MNLVRSLVYAVGMLSAWAVVVNSAWAAPPYKVDELVEIKEFDGKWYPATVIATNARGEVMAEYIWIGTRSTRKIFAPINVRYPYEANAMAPARLWSDATGTFKTKAALLKVNGEEIVIRKPDMKELTIKVATLSTGDQAFVRSLQKKISDAVASGKGWLEPPPAESFSTVGAVNPSLGSGQAVAVTPDPLPGYLKIKQGGVGFAKEHSFDRINAVIALGGADNWILGVVAPWSHRDEAGTGLLWVSLAKQKVEQRHMIPPGEVVVDYHPSSKRLLTRNSDKDTREEFFTLWHASPVEKEMKPLVKWAAEESIGSRNGWARIIDGKIVLQRSGKQAYAAWDTENKRLAYRVNQESFFGADCIISGGRKYLILPEDERVRILDAVSGNTISTLPAAASVASVALSDDGAKLAVLERYSLRVWELTDPEAPERRFAAEAIGTPFSTTMSWVGNDRLLAQSRQGGDLVLYSLTRGLALWTYELDRQAQPEHGATRTHEIIDQHLIYAASFEQGRSSGLAVGAVKLPGPKVDEVDAATDPESLLLIKPGAQIKLVVQCGEYDSQVRTAVETEIQRNGWTISESATTVMTASMKQGESQQVRYRMGGFGGQPVSEQSATLRPFISDLRLTVGDTEAWSSGTRTGAPGMVNLREGQTLQGEVDRWQKPNPGFFTTVDVPDKIMDPAKRNGLGKTLVTNRGLIPQ
ncbi:PQQ-binding-like beta-propeller repeat protein [Anatilimnocola sp. NA78]|uniref:outer membrane protein assembly factor BamB family protein n=1 Tax=Anatilimnocola sp. NA78 TaxID=3415683 RepID=UPI003CE45AFB